MKKMKTEEEAPLVAKQFVRVLGTLENEYGDETYVQADRFEDVVKIRREEYPSWLARCIAHEEVWTAQVKDDVYNLTEASDAMALISAPASPVAVAIQELAATIAYLPGVGTEYAAAKESFERKVE